MMVTFYPDIAAETASKQLKWPSLQKKNNIRCRRHVGSEQREHNSNVCELPVKECLLAENRIEMKA